MVWLGFEFAAGFFLFTILVVVVAWMCGFGVDTLDWWSNRLTPDEAKRRAALAAVGKWPPSPSKPWRRPLDWVLLAIGLALIAGLRLLFR